MTINIIGTCSLCGGPVSVPMVWHGVYPPTPTCTGCGAIKRGHGPVIDMAPAPQQYTNMNPVIDVSKISDK